LAVAVLCETHHCELTVPHVPDFAEACKRRVAIPEIVVTPRAPMRILLVMPVERRREITRQLLPLNAHLVFADPSGQTEEPIREDDIFQVAILPATLTDTVWWELWGVLGLLNKRPAILVYAREATFQLWSGVLEAGGYDVIVEPFSDGEICAAVSRAAQSFEEQMSNGF
jgi:PleD family two-component response regulator